MPVILRDNVIACHVQGMAEQIFLKFDVDVMPLKATSTSYCR
jgi:hypothetical protein